MTDPGLRDLVIAEGLKQARIHGVGPQCAQVYAEGWRAATEAAQPSAQERERELSLARRELERARVEVSNAHYWRDTARADRDVSQRELAGAKERIKIRDETIRDLRDDIAKVREIAESAEVKGSIGCFCRGNEHNPTSELCWQPVAWSIDPAELLAVLDGEGEKTEGEILAYVVRDPDSGRETGYPPEAVRIVRRDSTEDAAYDKENTDG